MLEALTNATQVFKGEDNRLQRLINSRLLVIDQQLAERHAKQVNAIALSEAKFDAVIAYLVGHDVDEALVRRREIFRERHAELFDPLLWQVEPDWLTALKRRG